MSTSRGVAQWVNPKRASSTSKTPSNRGASRDSRRTRYDSDSQSNSSFVQEDPIHSQQLVNVRSQGTRNIRNRSSSARHPPNQPESTKVDDTICRTICVIVEEYVKELREHQKQINQSRERLLLDVPQHLARDDFIAANDLSRLRVRNEQTKAIETIKQLTNYLKELSLIQRQGSSDELKDLVSEEILNKLSDKRNDIIHTLNDFVLANSDIDIPIVDPNDPTGGRDFDLCVEAQRSNRYVSRLEIAQSDDIENSINLNLSDSRPRYHCHQKPLADRTNRTYSTYELERDELDQDDKYKLTQIRDDYQVVEFDTRKREIHKLERETVELRNLFADFYNLVKTQGEHVDTIENNLVMAAQHISDGRNHLGQRPTRGLTLLVPMTGCITGALLGGPIGFFVGGKLGGVTIICATSLLGLFSSLGAQKCIETNKMK